MRKRDICTIPVLEKQNVTSQIYPIWQIKITLYWQALKFLILNLGWSPNIWGCLKYECRVCKISEISNSVLIGLICTDDSIGGGVDIVIITNQKLHFIWCAYKNVTVQVVILLFFSGWKGLASVVLLHEKKTGIVFFFG